MALQWRIHRGGGGDGGDRPPPYGFKKIFFLNIFIVKYWKIVDFLIQVLKITPKTHHPKKSPPVIHAGSYLRRRNRPEKYPNYPPPPPRIHGTSSTTPPRNRAEKPLQLPPLEFTELHRLPPPPRNRAKKLSPPVTRWPGSATVALQQSYVRQVVYASVNRWVFSCFLKVQISVSSWRPEGRSFQALGPT